MAYTRPSASAADATFTGAAAYTRPAASAADASFAPLNLYPAAGFTSTTFGAPASSRAQPATGFMPTTFGTPAINLNSTRLVTSLAPGAGFGAPAAAYLQTAAASGALTTVAGMPTHLRAQPATGFTTTQFGTSLGKKTQRPTGFTSAQFGTARLFPFHAAGFKPTTFGQARLFPFHVAPGLRKTTFGVLSGQQYWRAQTLLPTSRFGTPTTPTDRSAAVAGFSSSRLGAPFSLRVAAPNRSRTAYAWGFTEVRFGAARSAYLQTPAAAGFTGGAFGSARAQTPAAMGASAHGFTVVRFGAPHAGWLRTGGAAGFASGAFGVPGGTPVLAAAGVGPGAFGAASAILTAHALGFRPGMFGTPVSARGMHATTFGPSARFGLPEPVRSNAYAHYGFCASRFGQPAGASRFNYLATGFAGSALGTPGFHQKHRVQPVWPSGRLGTPLLKRTTQC